MKIHFSASTEYIEKRIETYRLIGSIIKNHGDELVRDWIEEAYKSGGAGYDDTQAASIASTTRAAIALSDIVIFEVTDQSFSLGYQAAYAASLQKPVLILRQPHSRPLGPVGTGIDSPLRSCSVYESDEDLREIIISFIEKNDVSTKDLRFNMVLERDLLYYLTNKSRETGVSKSQIVRDLIRRAAQKNNDKI